MFDQTISSGSGAGEMRMLNTVSSLSMVNLFWFLRQGMEFLSLLMSESLL